LVVSKHLVMIGCDRLYMCIQRVQARFAHADTKVALTSLACTNMVSEHGIPKATSFLVKIGLGVVDLIMAPPSINFNQFLEKEKLKGNGSNFTDWFRHVRIFLNGVSMQYVLEAPLGPPPPPAVSEDIKNVYETRVTRYSEVQCAILCSLEAELQKRFEHHDPCDMMRELKLIFETHAAVESYEASKQFFNCMMEEGSSVSEHMFAMSGHAKKLSDLGIVIPNQLGIHRVLQSLPPSYKNFVMNYNMQNMNKELPELFSMLKSAEVEIKKENQVLMVNKTTSFKKQGKPNKGNFKKGGKKVAAPPEKPKAGPKPETVCYYCQGKGHWKRNCTKYLADLKSGHVKKKGIFDIHVIDVYLTGSRSSAWVFDTGSVAHICNSQELRNKRSLARDEVTMRVGNGSKVDVIAVGTLPLHLPSGLVLNLNNCYLVPALSMNIISGSCLMQDGYSFKSENNGCSIYMSNVFYGHAPEMNGLFLLNLDSSDTHVHNIDAKRIKLNDNSTYMWHCRLGHIGVKRMKKLHSDGLLESLDFESLDRCEACLMGKMTKTPFSGTMERATDLLEIIHTDVCGPMSVASRGGYRYVLTFTDDLSRYGYIYFMKHKSETFEKFKEFQSEVENQRNKKIKFLRSDRGGEYLSYEFGMHLKKCGILSQLTPPGTPQRNETAAFTLNRAPSKSVETTPYELWFGKKPKLSFLKVWGCDAYVKKLQPDKLEPKAEKCVFIGYPKETIGYTFYHRSEGKIFVAKNGSFLEKEFLTKEVTGRKVELDEVDEPSLIDQSSAVPEEVPVQPAPIGEEANDDDHETSNEEATEPRRSTRERTTPDWYDPCLNVMIVDDNDEDPATYEEAMMSPDSNKWQEAMKSEMGSMYDNKVWTLVDLPDSRKAVENKWIFKRKTDADGNITVYKARLVAKGFRQIQGVDYDETFSPVAKLKSVRILLAIAAFFDYEIWQMDVKTAFLNGDIEEELYMVQPKGFVDPKNADKVCKLQRSIYGLKQASRSWNLRFDRVIKDFGFIRTHGEACIYKKVSGSSVAFLILYVDDILLIGNDIELLSSIKGYLNKSFSMKDLGEAAYILGIKIYRDRSRRLIGLSQSTYLDKILKKFRMDESKKGFLPMLPGKVLSKTQGPATADERERMSKIPYASAVGSIMYAMLCTRPDIAHAVSLTSRYQSDPGMEHWTAVKNILKYLKRTKDMFLCYGGDQELVVTSYTDASWNTDPDDSKSQSGYVFILNGAAVSWSKAVHGGEILNRIGIYSGFRGFIRSGSTLAPNPVVAPHHISPPSTFNVLLGSSWTKFFFAEFIGFSCWRYLYVHHFGAATKLLDDMMINYSEWHTERAPQGKKVNSVEETSSLSDKIDVIMSMLVNGRSNVDPNNVPLASLVAQEENVDVNFIKNNNFNNNAYRNNSGNNYRPYPSANGNGYGNSYGNSYNNNRSVPSGLEAMLKEFISTQTTFNKSVEEKLDKIDIIASRVDRLASDVNLLKLKVMPNNDIDNKITTTANAIQVRINENIRLMAELRARWDREENEKLAKENNIAKVWTITTTSNVNSSHVAAPPTINGKIIGVGNVSTPSAKRTKLPEIAKTAETACDKTAEIFSNLGNNDPIAVAHNDLDFDDCHISEVIKFLQKLAKSPNASAINLAFTKHITNALIKAREEKLKLETSIPRKLEDGWEPIIKMKFNEFECNALCDLGASISVMPKKIYDMLDLPPLKNYYLDVNLADNVKKKPLGRIDNVRITVNNNLVPVDFVVLDIECNASCPIVLGRPFLRTVGAVIDMREGNIKYQFPLKKGMEHFPRKRMKLPFDSIIRTSYDVDASTLDVT
ncbi:hypothetical protein QYE76_071902, partial [Lolium multiflorum]